MEIPQIRVGSESKSAEGACADKAGGHGGSAEFDCARGIAQAEGVLREISSGRRRRSELSSSVGQKAESAIPGSATIRGSKSHTQSYRSAAQFGLFDLRLVKAILDPLPLDPGLCRTRRRDWGRWARPVAIASPEDGCGQCPIERGRKLKEIAACASLPEEPVRCAGTSKSCSTQETKGLP